MGLKSGRIIGKVLHKPYKVLQLDLPFDSDHPQFDYNWYHQNSLTSEYSTEDSIWSSSSTNLPLPAKIEIDISTGIFSVSVANIVNTLNYNIIEAHLNTRVPSDPALINSTISFTNNSLQAFTMFFIHPLEFIIFGSAPTSHGLKTSGLTHICQKR